MEQISSQVGFTAMQDHRKTMEVHGQVLQVSKLRITPLLGFMLVFGYQITLQVGQRMSLMINVAGGQQASYYATPGVPEPVRARRPTMQQLGGSGIRGIRVPQRKVSYHSNKCSSTLKAIIYGRPLLQNPDDRIQILCFVLHCRDFAPWPLGSKTRGQD